MTPIQLIHGDAIEEMRKIPDASIDFILTDPPYGITACKWDAVIPFAPMWEQLHRIVKPNGAIALFGSEPFSSSLRMSNIKNYKYDWYWKKPRGTGHLNAKKMPMNDIENISIFYAASCLYSPQFTPGKAYIEKSGWKGTEGYEGYGVDRRIGNNNPGIRYPKRLIEFGVVERGTVHPTQKPVALLEYLIKTYTLEGETVLDFTMGSGSTGVAAKNLNRRFIGIEKDEKYFEIARTRIFDEYNVQPSII